MDSSHLYQLYAYIKTQEHISEHHQKAMGILLYPTISHTTISEKIVLHQQAMRIETIDLTLPWQEIERNLLATIINDPN